MKALHRISTMAVWFWDSVYMKILIGVVVAGVTLGGLMLPQKSLGYRVGDKLSSGNTAKGSAFVEIKWEDLAPKGWDPMSAFRGLDLAGMSDGDPRAAEALKKLSEDRNQTPVVKEMQGRSVRISGFLIPISKANDAVLDFLLVPYFGACIHTPPPPSNMIIRVVPDKPYKGGESMDAVTVSGVLTIDRTDSPWGAASYRLSGKQVVKYVEPKPR